MKPTQLYLPEALRREIDRYRKTKSESLSEFIRKAVEERIEEDKRRKVGL